MTIGELIKSPFVWFWYTATPRTKFVIVALAASLIAAAFFFSGKDTRPAIEDDDAYKALQGENNLLREQNTGLRKEYEAAIAKGQTLELERDALENELKRFGVKAAEGVKLQQEAAIQFEKDTAEIGIDIPPVDRCLRYCSHRAESGFPCRPNLETYCKRYQ